MPEFQHVSSEDEITTVARLARRIWCEHYTPIIGQDQVDYMLAKFQSKEAVADQITNSHEYYLVEKDNTPVGYFAVVPPNGDDRMMLSKFYLNKSARGQGLGRDMLDFVEHICHQSHTTTIRLRVNKNNTDSIKWYQRNGFTKVASVVKDIGNGFVMDDYIMKKVINI